MGTHVGPVWERYDLGETLSQVQRMSRREGKQLPSQMAVWIDGILPYYGDPAEALAAAKEHLLQQMQVRHPALPAFVDAWEQDNGLYWVYRAMAGPTIPEFLVEHKPTLPALASLLVDLAQAILAIHRKGFVHGNLDTRSVLVIGKRRVTLTGRGIRNYINSMLNQSSLETGVNKEFRANPLEDIAAWGEILGACLTGEPEFGRVRLTARAVGTFELREAQDCLRRHAVTGSLPDVVLRAAKAKHEPEHSYQSMEQALEAFLEAIEHDIGSEGGAA